MDKKEQIIAIIFGDKKLFFKASLISIRNASTQSTSELEEIPDGKVKEYYADLCMEKTYKNGRLESSLTFTGRTERSVRQNILEAIHGKNESVVPINEGKTFLRNIHQRIFFINGKQTALQELNEAGEVINTTGQTFSGEAKEFYPNGNIKIEAFFENGLPVGTVKTYDKEGRLISLEEYKNGLKEGKAKRFNFLHDIPSEEELNFKAGLLHGTRNIFGPDGKLLMSEEYKDGKRNGQVKMYNNDGVMEIKAEYKNGKKNGKRTFYYQNGALMHEENFTDGLLEGKRNTYSQKGVLLVEENYKNNLLSGQKTIYDMEGKIKAVEFYEGGKLLKREEK